MKNMIVAIVGLLALNSFGAKTVKYSPTNSNTQEVKIELGASDGLKVGDKIRALEKDCTFDGRSKGCGYTTVGFLTVEKVDGEKSVIAKPDSDLKLNENIYFEKDSTCQDKRTSRDKGCY
tara:strand:+ start:30353 stop:30712 length:360 start_codon:yes stop_codon:yes gene_type:complete